MGRYNKCYLFLISVPLVGVVQVWLWTRLTETWEQIKATENQEAILNSLDDTSEIVCSYTDRARFTALFSVDSIDFKV